MHAELVTFRWRTLFAGEAVSELAAVISEQQARILAATIGFAMGSEVFAEALAQVAPLATAVHPVGGVLPKERRL